MDGWMDTNETEKPRDILDTPKWLEASMFFLQIRPCKFQLTVNLLPIRQLKHVYCSTMFKPHTGCKFVDPKKIVDLLSVYQNPFAEVTVPDLLMAWT